MIIGIGFSTTSFPLSWLIRKLTNSKESHTWIYIDNNQEIFVYEAGLYGFVKVNIEQFKKDNKIIKLVKPDWDLSTGLKDLESWLGEKYDYEELAGSVWVIIGRWFKQKWHNLAGSKKKALDCAQAVVKFLQLNGYPSSVDLSPSDITPQDLDNMLSNEPVIPVK